MVTKQVRHILLALFISTYLQVSSSINTIPAAPISVMEGEDVFLLLDVSVENIENCTLLRPNDNTPIDLLLNGIEAPGNTDVKYWGSLIDNDCGAWVSHVNYTNRGSWNLTATNESTFEYGLLDISIIQDSYERDPTGLILGSNGYIEIGPSTGRYFQAVDPLGYAYPLQYTKGLDIYQVTSIHEGNWILKYAMQGKTEETVDTVPVEVISEIPPIVTTVVEKSNMTATGLTLLCHSKKGILELCRFIRPDGTGMLMTQGIGNSDYSYYGNNINYDCGITIHEPTSVDYGIWQCGIKYSNEWIGEFITISNTSGAIAEITVSTTQTRVVGFHSQSVQLLCHANTRLTACWFQLPNGTVYAPSEAGVENIPPFKYFGLGLLMGDCGIQLTLKPEDEFEEDWTCNMAIADNQQGDLKTTITLRATEHWLTSTSTVVEASSGESAFLICRSSKEFTPLDYCRFIRPDGQGITFLGNTSAVILNTYSYGGDGLDKGDCGIHISSVGEADFGEWTCAARLMNIYIESSVTITLESTDLTVGAIVGIAIGAIALLCIIIGVIYFAIRKRS